MEKWVGVVYILFRPGHRMTLVEVPCAFTSELDSTIEFCDSSDDVPIVKVEIVEKFAPWDLRALTYN